MNITRQPIRPKGRPFASAAWRDSARGKPCTLRLDCCNGDTETTVLCHIRHFGWAGVAQKPPDYLAVYACSNCHAALDGHEGWGWEDLLRALGETLMMHEREGRL